MATVAEGEVFGFAATTSPDGAGFFDLHGMGSLAGAFVRAVAVGWVLGLATGADIKILAGLRVDFVGEGLPAHRMIIR